MLNNYDDPGDSEEGSRSNANNSERKRDQKRSDRDAAQNRERKGKPSKVPSGKAIVFKQLQSEGLALSYQNFIMYVKRHQEMQQHVSLAQLEDKEYMKKVSKSLSKKRNFSKWYKHGKVRPALSS